MTDERLLARLRGHGNKDTIAAADRIEALTAERDEARVAINQIGKCIGVLGAVQCVGDIVVEAEKRFSRLAKAVEGLREIAGECGCSTARAIIAEIEGEKG